MRHRRSCRSTRQKTNKTARTAQAHVPLARVERLSRRVQYKATTCGGDNDKPHMLITMMMRATTSNTMAMPLSSSVRSTDAYRGRAAESVHDASPAAVRTGTFFILRAIHIMRVMCTATREQITTMPAVSHTQVSQCSVRAVDLQRRVATCPPTAFIVLVRRGFCHEDSHNSELYTNKRELRCRV